MLSFTKALRKLYKESSLKVLSAYAKLYWYTCLENVKAAIMQNFRICRYL